MTARNYYGMLLICKPVFNSEMCSSPEAKDSGCPTSTLRWCLSLHSMWDWIGCDVWALLDFHAINACLSPEQGMKLQPVCATLQKSCLHCNTNLLRIPLTKNVTVQKHWTDWQHHTKGGRTVKHAPSCVTWTVEQQDILAVLGFLLVIWCPSMCASKEGGLYEQHVRPQAVAHLIFNMRRMRK